MTQHNHTPLPFGRKVPVGECPRCDELRAGAAPRAGWGRAEQDRRRVAEIKAHDCARSRCGPVCTFGEW